MRLDDIEHHYAQINGIRMHYARAGRGERLVVLLHGFPECWYSWRHQIPALAERFTVVAPDMRGYNETEKPGWGYELDVLTQDVVELIRSLGHRRANVVGHDWGGAIAWALAIAFPQRVERLAILNAPHPARFGPRAGMSLRQMLRSSYMLFFQLPLVPEALIRSRDFRMVDRWMGQQVRNPAGMSPADLRFYRQALARPGALSAALAYYRRGLLSAGGMFRGTGLRVAAPTLLIWGEDDVFLGKELTYGTERFVPDLRVRYIKGASHWVQQDAPATVTDALLGFL